MSGTATAVLVPCFSSSVTRWKFSKFLGGGAVLGFQDHTLRKALKSRMAVSLRGTLGKALSIALGLLVIKSSLIYFTWED